ncbi:alpha/beta hydrolase [Ideonella sp.]|uniref:alpha/beta hydrolase n=1 Tax=Ideonella sp. TaxID=1929293 RepID=UPI002B4A93E3|nr:alpha/beta hydrolase [Ideonella sp.]HJV69616.1 alpha/beta hydrolase [Ideonella sp.]
MTTPTTDKLSPPGALRLALEWRAPTEAAASLILWPWLRRGARGDGHSVLVLPGLAAGDGSTLLLRRYLRAQGWRPHAWRQGLNLGPRHGVLEACLERLQRLHADAGRPISLVGWSLGGVYSREMAKRMPQAVRQVITLGSPAAGRGHASNARRLYEFVSGARAYAPELMARLHEPVPVPCTSIYSRSDGIVDWRASLQPEGPSAQNIRVPASHTGMGLNPVVLRLIAERLSRPEQDWQPHEGAPVCKAS